MEALDQQGDGVAMRGKKNEAFKKKKKSLGSLLKFLVWGTNHQGNDPNIPKKWIQTTVWIFRNRLVKFLRKYLEHHWRWAITRKTSNLKNLEQRLGLTASAEAPKVALGLTGLCLKRYLVVQHKSVFIATDQMEPSVCLSLQSTKWLNAGLLSSFLYWPFTGYVSGCRSAPFKGGLRPNWGYGRDEEREGWSGQGAQGLHLLTGKRESHLEYVPLHKAN